MAAGRKKRCAPASAGGRLSRGSGEGRSARRGGRGRGRRGRQARLYPEALRAIGDSQDDGSGRGEHRHRPRGQPASDAVRLDGATVIGVGEGLLGDSQRHRGQDERRNQKEAPVNQSTTHDGSIPPRADALSKNVMIARTTQARGAHRILRTMVGARPRGSWSSRRRLLAALALSLYALLAAISPALHHDLACHVKSPGHCDACVANPLASRTEPAAGLDAPTMRALRETPDCAQPREHWAPVAPASGRAPPA